MKIEFTLNTFHDGDWWIDLGISYQKTDFHPTHRRLFTVGLLITTLYIRWGNKKKI